MILCGKKTHRKVTTQFKGRNVRETEAENPRGFAAFGAQRWRNFNIIRPPRLLERSGPPVAAGPSDRLLRPFTNWPGIP